MVNHYLTPGAIIDSNNTWNGDIQTFSNGLTIGLAASAPAPDNDTVHIWAGSADDGGTVTAFESLLSIEDNVDMGMSLLAPAGYQRHIFFAEGGADTHGALRYYGSTDTPASTFAIAVNNQGDGWRFTDAGTPTITTQGPGKFATSTGALTLDPATDVHILDDKGLVVGHTAKLPVADENGDEFTPEVQILGNDQDDSALLLFQGSTNPANIPELIFGKGGSGTIGTKIIMTDGEDLGSISWVGDDGFDYLSVAAKIVASVDGSPTSNNMPGRLAFFTTTSGAYSTERWRITSVGALTSLTAAPANAATTDGGITATGGIAFTDVANAWIDDATHGSGTVTHYIGNQTITTSSDSRVKTDWEPWEGSALDVISPAQLGKYRYNLPGGGSQTEGYGPNARGEYLGFKAQDAIKWAPWIVNAGAGVDCPQCVAEEECDEHGYWHVEYQHLVPLLVKAIQELKEQVEALGG
jgi:hypothetical protein